VKITIQAIPPSLNRFAGRRNEWEYRKVKAEWKDMVYIEAKKECPVCLGKAVVTISYYFPTKARHDPDNYAGKVILDGLTAAGVIRDDSFDCIELRLCGGHDKANPRTEIDIQPA